MGMDLYPAQDGIDTYHANWTSWGMLGDLLTELGCDLSAMSGSNDGHKVDASTAQAWGEAVLSNLGRIHVSIHADDGFSGANAWSFTSRERPRPSRCRLTSRRWRSLGGCSR